MVTGSANLRHAVQRREAVSATGPDSNKATIQDSVSHEAVYKIQGFDILLNRNDLLGFLHQNSSISSSSLDRGDADRQGGIIRQIHFIC